MNALRVAIADPPYPGCCKLYGHDHREPYGCWDEPAATQRLIYELEGNYDGWALHTSSVALLDLLPMWPKGVRLMSWVKPFAAFKANVPVAYAWEPVIVKPARKQVVAQRMVMRDFISEGITLERGTVGAKPERVSMWLFEMLGMEPTDEFVDLFPGSGAITAAHQKWCGQFDFALAAVSEGSPNKDAPDA